MKVICLLGENDTLSTLNRVKAAPGFQNRFSLLLFVPMLCPSVNLLKVTIQSLFWSNSEISRFILKKNLFFFHPTEMSMGDSYEEPANYRVDSVITVSKENRWHSLQRQKPQARKPVGMQMKGQSIAKRNSSVDLRSGKTTYQRAQSVQNMLPPSYDSVVGNRPLSAVVPVAMPVVPNDPRLLRSVSEDRTSLSKYAMTSKSTPNLDNPVKDSDFMNGHGSPPNETRRELAYNQPFSYATLDRSKPRAASSHNVETVVATPVKATVVSVENMEAKPDITVVATPVEVFESRPAAETGASKALVKPSGRDETVGNKAEKPAVPPKPRTLSDALQEAVAARSQRMSRKSSVPETEAPSALKPTDPKERKTSAPAKFSHRKKVESSEKVRSEIMTCLEEKFVEVDSNVDRSSVEHNGTKQYNTMPRQQERGDKESSSLISKGERSDLNKAGLVLASSADIYRRYTSPTSPTRDMNRQSSMDSTETGRKSSMTRSEKFKRQLSEPISIDRQPSACASDKQSAPPLPSSIQLDVRAKPSVPPPPSLPITKKKDVPATPVIKGLITADALSANKSKLKSAAKDKSTSSSPAASGGSHNFAVQHTNLLAKAVAARAARISTQAHSDTDSTTEGHTERQAQKTGDEKQFYSLERNNNKVKSSVLEARAVNSRGKPTPPVPPKKRLSSPDMKQRMPKRDEPFDQRKVSLSGDHSPGSVTERSLPFDVPAPVLSEEDRSVMLLDEVIRKEAESENWSLNSWNSGSDSSTEIFVPPPVWPSEQHELCVENPGRPWYECSSQSEESISSKASEPEKFNKTITTKKGFQIKLTFESKREDTKPVRTSPRTDYNDIDVVEPVTPTLKVSTRTESISRTDSQPVTPLEIVDSVESPIDNELNTPIPDNADENSSFELPPPPLLFTDSADEPYMALESPPLPPPPEFSPTEPKASVFYPQEDRDNAASSSPSAGSDDSNKVW